MECNKEEAVRAKDMAEKYLLEGDINGAKRLALKVQSLFPELNGLSQFIDIINIHIAGDRKINEAPDYYGILGADPLADEDTLKKQYRKMALALHPDKNKSVGADAAFQILSQAWSVLSEKESRNAYHLKINILPQNQIIDSSCSTSAPNTIFSTSANPTQSRRYSEFTTYSVPSRQDFFSGFVHPMYRESGAYFYQNPRPTSQDFGFVPVFNPMYPAVGVHNPSRPPRKENMSSTRTRSNTFWTSCNRCKTHFEYKNMYLNKILECPRCKQSFKAIKIPAPNLKAKGSHYWNIGRNTEDLSTFLSRLREKFRNISQVSSERMNVFNSEATMNKSLKNYNPDSKELSNIELRKVLMRNAKMALVGQLNKLFEDGEVNKDRQTEESLDQP
ncbi:uncharacterized protein LOC127245048 [Andrographis paniculata]|uniref:uncharacterized protein LOC127245048 n=1 Tax=Andrographis paniculata TaxID=175694 RepID=UPI0021E73396|nr:uncharacterized protein LOC127245048 [Andrographis paniculata]